MGTWPGLARNGSKSSLFKRSFNRNSKANIFKNYGFAEMAFQCAFACLAWGRTVHDFSTQAKQYKTLCSHAEQHKTLLCAVRGFRRMDAQEALLSRGAQGFLPLYAQEACLGQRARDFSAPGCPGGLFKPMSTRLFGRCMLRILA